MKAKLSIFTWGLIFVDENYFNVEISPLLYAPYNVNFTSLTLLHFLVLLFLLLLIFGKYFAPIPLLLLISRWKFNIKLSRLTPCKCWHLKISKQHIAHFNCFLLTENNSFIKYFGKFNQFSASFSIIYSNLFCAEMCMKSWAKICFI